MELFALLISILSFLPLVGMAWNDAVSTTRTPLDLPLQCNDSLPSWGDFTPALSCSYRILADEDTNIWSDAVTPTPSGGGGDLTLPLADSLVAFQDAIVRAGASSFAATDNLANWADAHQLLLAQRLALTGAAGDALLGWNAEIATKAGGAIALSDNANNWNDAVTKSAAASRAVSDSFTLSDAVAASSTSALAVADSFTLSDATAASATSALELADLFTLTDAVETDRQDITATELPLDVSDFIVQVDAAELHSDQFLAVGDTFALTDAELAPVFASEILLTVADLLPTQTDAVQTSTGEAATPLTSDLADDLNAWADVTPVLSRNYRILADDSNSLDDAVSTSLGEVGADQQINVSDTFTLTDFTPTLSGDYLLELTDSQTQSDAVATQTTPVIADLTKSVADSFTVSDAAVFSATSARSLSDDCNNWQDLVQTSAPQGPALTLGLADSISQNDAITIRASGSLDVNDFITQVDVVTFSSTDTLALADDFSLSDGAVQAATEARALSDSLPGFTDASTRSVGLQLSVADSITQTDAVTFASTVSLDVNDFITQVDVVGFSSAGSRAFADDANRWLDAIATSAPQGPSLQLGLTDSFTLADAVSNRASASIALADSTGQTDAIRTSIGLLIAVADDAANLDDATATSATGEVLLSDTQPQTDALALGYGLLATDDAAGLADAVDSSISEVGKLPIVDSLPVQADALQWALGADLTGVKRIYVVPADPRSVTVEASDRTDTPIPE